MCWKKKQTKKQTNKLILQDFGKIKNKTKNPSKWGENGPIANK